MNNPSVKKRFLASFLANGLRAGLLFLAGLFVARGLGPDGYGTFTFLTGSFMAIIQLLDMGASSAFYTFISQRHRGRSFINIYLVWHVVQLAIPILVIWLLLPDSYLNKIWLGQPRILVVLAFAAIFFKQQIWQTITQIGESQRLTYRMQALSIIVAVSYFILVWLAWLFEKIDLEGMFGIFVVQYTLALVIAYFWFMPAKNANEVKPRLFEVVKEYRVYCTPLLLSAWLGFGYTFADTWLLQNYGGSRQQGYYAVGYQLAMIGQIVTLALFQIIWKEIAEAYANNNLDRARGLYTKSSRFIFITVAALCIFFVPWSEEILLLSTGSEFVEGKIILAVMFFYPLYQCLNYIADAWLLATAQVRIQSLFGIVFMLVSIISSYFLLAPPSANIPGFGLGGLGTAIKLLILNVVYANAKIFWIARKQNWRFDWSYQVLGIVLFSIMSAGACFIGNQFFQYPILIRMGLALFLYSGIVLLTLNLIPELGGVTRGEARNLKMKLRSKLW